jgi:5'-nucleotidase
MKQTVYVDMDGVLCDYYSAFERERLCDPAQPYPQSVAGFYRGLEPIQGAVEGSVALSSHPMLDVHILTAPSIYNPLCYTEKRLWVEDHLGFDAVKRLIIAPDKSLLSGDVLIDDQAEGRGQDRFQGRLMLFGSEECPNWKICVQFLADRMPSHNGQKPCIGPNSN